MLVEWNLKRKHNICITGSRSMTFSGLKLTCHHLEGDRFEENDLIGRALILNSQQM
ncbi:MAG: hypothetical protein QOF02_277 [Blastocatellia bacterium]|nr:hypothetical protein [Blastocatellia bacterium]